MIKTITKILLITIIISVNLVSLANSQPVKLSSSNILEEANLELTIDSIPATASVVKQDDLLYIDPSFFQSNFGIEVNNFPENQCGVIKDRTGKEQIYIPLLSALSYIKTRYTYSSQYNKEIIRIRTDNGFKVYKSYEPGLSDIKTGTENKSKNNPAIGSNVTQYTTTRDLVSEYNSKVIYGTGMNSSSYYTGYPVVNYSYPSNYGYYYPQGYTPGYYFGNYGFVPQGPAPNNIYSNSNSNSSNNVNVNSSGNTITVNSSGNNITVNSPGNNIILNNPNNNIMPYNR
jgi:hypothetical protein